MSIAALRSAYDQADAFVNTSFDTALRLKEQGVDLSGLVGGGSSLMSSFGGDTKYSERYSLLRGWVWSALHALADAGSQQDFNVAKLTGPKQGERRFRGSKSVDKERQTTEQAQKDYARSKMVQSAFQKTAQQDFELLFDHEIYTVMEQPNPCQSQQTFVYNFIMNLGLTGWSYVICGADEEGNMRFYSLPTTWIKPDHREGAFSAFRIQNPSEVGKQPIVIPRDNVGFAHIPNPADPLSAMAPAASQMAAIRIDDHIQTSQTMFFRNGVFPSVAITIGDNPMGDGSTPRLEGPQRRAIESAIRRMWSNVNNYGTPVILDGLVKSIERMSATQNEMGWDKSEDKVRTRILSAYQVHPFILGEQMAGSYAQAYVVESRFYDKVNSYLSMLSTLMTVLLGSNYSEERLMCWWTKKEAVDPQIRSTEMREARKNGDISKNEHRAYLGLSPVEEDVERNALLNSVGGMTGAVQLLSAAGQGMIPADSAVYLLSQFLEIPIDDLESGLNLQGGTAQATETLQQALSYLSLGDKEARKVAGHLNRKLGG